jgi:acetolactate synthase-1/2/3 large subunit
MKTLDIIAEILKIEGINHLSAFPTTNMIESAAKIGIKPIICRQERAGVGIADGFSRINNGAPLGVFAMQYGPGAENAYSGIATAYSDSVPLLLLPLGHPTDRDRIFPNFSSIESFSTITKYAEQINYPNKVVDTMRRAFAHIRMGRPGPVLVEIPTDIAESEVSAELLRGYSTTPSIVSQGNPSDVDKMAKILLGANNPVIYAGQGVLYAEATLELEELAELTGIAVTTTMAGKSAFSEIHPLSLGSSSGVMNDAVYHYIDTSDVVLGIGTSFTKHGMTTTIPQGKTLLQITNDPRDISKSYDIKNAVIGDCKLVLRQLIDAIKDLQKNRNTEIDNQTVNNINILKTEWLQKWEQKLNSKEIPMTPYRVINEFMKVTDPSKTIVTHDSGSPRDQIMPFYKSNGPRTYIGWGKSHGLGTGLGLIIGAKLAAPEKLCVNFMGDAAFGMIGLDFETAVRSNIPTLTVVFNNNTMAIEINNMQESHDIYNTRDLKGDYTALAKAMDGWAEKVTNPEDIQNAFIRAKTATENGQAALLEFITSEEQDFSNRRAFS